MFKMKKIFFKVLRLIKRLPSLTSKPYPPLSVRKEVPKKRTHHKMKKGLLIVLLIIQIHYNVVVNGNELESEFSFDSHVARMLYDVSVSVCGKTGNSYNKAVRCPQTLNYRSCLPSRNGRRGPRQCCGDFSRIC